MLKYCDTTMEVVFSYSYLGLTFNDNGKYSVAQKICSAKCRKLDLSVDIVIRLFDSTVKPVRLYRCEVWKPNDLGLADKLVFTFLKQVFKTETEHTYFDGSG